MNTKLLMTVSAVLLAVTGILLTFVPQELINYFSSTPSTRSDALILQILGALYFSFGMVNWTAKANLIGGIYGRPIAIGNLIHFIIGALTLIKGYAVGNDGFILIASIIYSLFAVLFGLVFFTHPVKTKDI